MGWGAWGKQDDKSCRTDYYWGQISPEEELWLSIGIPLEFLAEHWLVNVCEETSQGSGMKTLKEFKVISPEVHIWSRTVIIFQSQSAKTFPIHWVEYPEGYCLDSR